MFFKFGPHAQRLSQMNVPDSPKKRHRSSGRNDFRAIHPVQVRLEIAESLGVRRETTDLPDNKRERVKKTDKTLSAMIMSI